jgi:hypothetical protein
MRGSYDEGTSNMTLRKLALLHARVGVRRAQLYLLGEIF